MQLPIFLTMAVVAAFSTGGVAAQAADCKGSSLCKGLSAQSCDIARSQINPNKIYKTGGEGSGTCSGSCGIFVQGAGCQYFGYQLQAAYDFMRTWGCQKCGSYHDGSCLITVNYVTGCSQ